jgi:hypothetical protein
MSKNKRSTTHVVIYYKDGSTYNIRRAEVVSTHGNKVRIVASVIFDKGMVVTPVGTESLSYRVATWHTIDKIWVDKVEEIDENGHSEWINF